jgi:hypothetical protein
MAGAALLFLGLSSPGVAHAQPSPTPDPAAPAAPKTLIDADGTYKVNVDIAPGTYTSGGPADAACYWKRANGDKLLDNALTKKPQTVRIEPTDTTFTTTSCQPWQLAACGTACPPPPPPPGPLGMIGDLTRFLGPAQFGGGPRP